jgi:hypothetical protein
VESRSIRKIKMNIKGGLLGENQWEMGDGKEWGGWTIINIHVCKSHNETHLKKFARKVKKEWAGGGV